jgi:hypothetical protein
MADFTITQLEVAINFWREKEPTSEGNDSPALCAPARALATPYTVLFMNRRESISAAELTPEQLDAVTTALATINGSGQ